jgi:hypothetical protein
LRIKRTDAEMACQTARVHYHEQFWVVVGTTAPVVALAVLVAWWQSGRTRDRALRRRDKRLMGGTSAAEVILTASMACELFAFTDAVVSLASMQDQTPVGYAAGFAIAGYFAATSGWPLALWEQERNRRAAEEIAEGGSPPIKPPEAPGPVTERPAR